MAWVPLVDGGDSHVEPTGCENIFVTGHPILLGAKLCPSRGYVEEVDTE